MRQFTVADAMIKTLVHHGVTTIFGYPGGAILPFYDALPHHPEIEHVLVRHEQGAAFAAQGWARTRRGEVGVCCATSGPGATNLVTGIADASMDSIPILCITGQVPLSMLGKDMFQETDMVGVTMSITKHNYILERAEDVVPMTTEAIHLALSGRTGPVHIDAPKDIMAQPHPEEFEIPELSLSKSDAMYPAYEAPKKHDLDELLRALKNAKRPLMLLGQGIKHAGAETLVQKLVEKLQIPAVHTILAKAVLPEDHDQNLGMLGMHGFYHSNLATHHADLIFNIGSRFDDRIVGRYDAFAKEAYVVHVDIDAAELNKVVETDLPIQCDAKLFLESLLGHPELASLDTSDWMRQIQAWRDEEPYQFETEDFTMRTCLATLQELIERDPESYILVTDVGQHQMWTALSCKVGGSLKWLTSGGAGTMGFALPTAIGAAFAHPDKIVLCVSGDGGFQMNMQELMLMKEYNLNVKALILNNEHLGLVRQWQELFYEENYSSVSISSPNYQKIAEAYGLAGYVVSSKDNPNTHKNLLSEPGPVLIEYRVEKEENMFPMVPGGKTLGQTITK